MNLDGIRAIETTPENYPGLAPEITRAQLAELSATFEAQATAMAAPLSDQQHQATREQHRQLGGQSAVDMFERNLAPTDGTTYVRPNNATVAAFRSQLNDPDIFDVFTAAQCPLLICAATKNLPETEQFRQLLDAHRRGVERDLAVAERANPHLRVEHVPASHGMIHEEPGTLATLIRDFLG